MTMAYAPPPLIVSLHAKPPEIVPVVVDMKIRLSLLFFRDKHTSIILSSEQIRFS